MEVKISQAIRVFFSSPSFEMVFFEAFANALDAEATEISIDIKLTKKENLQDLILLIKDNGVGFTDERFSKFGKLLDVDEESHKGLGRLVYLCYFNQIEIESYYEQKKKRRFIFTENFQKESEVTYVENTNSGTTLRMSDFSGKRFAKWENAQPQSILNLLLDKFYLRLYKNKLQENNITIHISSNVDQISSDSITFNTSDLPELNHLELQDKIDLFHPLELYYYIKKLPPKEANKQRVVTAIGVDDRSQVVDIISRKTIPPLYDMVFLLVSEHFKGNVDGSRQNIRIEESEYKQILSIFKKAIFSILQKEIPEIEKENKKQKEDLEHRFPHLSGYIEEMDFCYMNKNEALKKAQDKYFQEQKEILSADKLSEEQFEKSTILSARALAEYIIFRQNTIKKLQSLSRADKEKDLHNIILPQRSEFHSTKILSDIYLNNLWVIDDRFMTYHTALSEAEMTRIYELISKEEKCEKNAERPDITIFFSSDPNTTEGKLDIVVIELKRLGIKADQNSIVEFQLDSRTIQLAKYYSNRIQRMWFYGIVDIDDVYKLHLINNGYSPLFSKGSIYFRSKEIFPSLDKETKVIQNAYIMDYTALVEDANYRNSIFLKILQGKFKESSEQ